MSYGRSSKKNSSANGAVRGRRDLGLDRGRSGQQGGAGPRRRNEAAADGRRHAGDGQVKGERHAVLRQRRPQPLLPGDPENIWPVDGASPHRPAGQAEEAGPGPPSRPALRAGDQTSSERPPGRGGTARGLRKRHRAGRDLHLVRGEVQPLHEAGERTADKEDVGVLQENERSGPSDDAVLRSLQLLPAAHVAEAQKRFRPVGQTRSDDDAGCDRSCLEPARIAHFSLSQYITMQIGQYLTPGNAFKNAQPEIKYDGKSYEKWKQDDLEQYGDLDASYPGISLIYDSNGKKYDPQTQTASNQGVWNLGIGVGIRSIEISIGWTQAVEKDFRVQFTGATTGGEDYVGWQYWVDTDSYGSGELDYTVGYNVKSELTPDNPTGMYADAGDSWWTHWIRWHKNNLIGWLCCKSQLKNFEP